MRGMSTPRAMRSLPAYIAGHGFVEASPNLGAGPRRARPESAYAQPCPRARRDRRRGPPCGFRRRPATAGIRGKPRIYHTCDRALGCGAIATLAAVALHSGGGVALDLARVPPRLAPAVVAAASARDPRAEPACAARCRSRCGGGASSARAFDRGLAQPL